MKTIIGCIVTVLLVSTMQLGIWWTGLWAYVTLAKPDNLNTSVLLIWTAISIALSLLLLWAVAKWGA